METETTTVLSWALDPKAKAPVLNRTTLAIIQITSEIAKRHNLTVAQVTGAARIGKIVKARNELYFELYMRLPHLPITQIARRMGRDHSTIIKVLQKVCRDRGLTYPPRADR